MFLRLFQGFTCNLQRQGKGERGFIPGAHLTGARAGRGGRNRGKHSLSNLNASFKCSFSLSVHDSEQIFIFLIS